LSGVFAVACHNQLGSGRVHIVACWIWNSPESPDAGDSFNDIAAIDSRPYAANCVALSETQGWLLPYNSLVIELSALPRGQCYFLT
jgi:CRP-like cAMP-binding protein